MFAYQPTYSMLELKKDKDTDYVIRWKWKGLFKLEIFPLHGAFLPNIKYFEYKIGIQFNNTPLVAEQINYMNKLWKLTSSMTDDWLTNLLNNLKKIIACLRQIKLPK